MSLLTTDQVLGPPVMWPPTRDDHQTLGRMAGRVKPCPKFPRSFKDEPYRAWRLGLVHWVWQMRTACICEALLGAPPLEALKDGASGVWEAAVMLDPRILRSGGRPADGNYWGDPGELSGPG